MPVVALLAAVTTTAAAQQPDSAVAAFLASARAGSARYQEQATAMADGYRAIGPDFPTMGEHWVSIPLVAQGAFDPARPSVLEYAIVDGRPRLVGVAWALPLSEGRRPPAFPPEPHAWHYHTGTVDDESFVAGHADPGHEPPQGPTVAVLHAWIWLENPDGVFATDNWALPWARLGLGPPAGAGRDAGRAAALAAGGERYFRILARVVARPDSVEAARIDSAIARAAAEAGDAAAAARRRGAATLDDAAALEGIWRGLWVRAGDVVSDSVRARLQVLGAR